MSGGMSLFTILVLGVVALGLLGVLALGVYLLVGNRTKDSERKAGR